MDLFVQRLIAIIFALIVASWISSVAWKRGFYRLPVASEDKGHLRWWLVLEAFVLFFFVQVIAGPSLYVYFLSWLNPGVGSGIEGNQEGLAASWANIWSAAWTAAALIVFFLSLPSQTQREILGRQGSAINAKAYLAGGLSWVIVYPWILALGQTISAVVEGFYQGPHIDQVAVKHLKDTFDNPILFLVTAVAIVTIIPFLEELLFRAFLQTWFKYYMGRMQSIAATSLIFALFHFSFSQGIENIELVLSLFLLSCFLGFLKEKYQSLWASVGLHSTFNFISILMLLVTT